MKVSAIKEYVKRRKSDCLIIPFFEKTEIASDNKIEKKWMGPIKTGDFSGKKDEISLIYLDGKRDKRVLLLGLGEKKKLSSESIRNSFAEAIKKCQKIKASNVNILFPVKCEKDNLFQIILESIFLSNYLFHKLKRESLKEERRLVKTIQIIGVTGKKIIERVKTIATGVHFARDLVNNNADDETPKRLAQTAKEMANISKNVKVTIFDKKRIEREKMGLLLAVNKGSFRDPYFIRIDYEKGKKDKTVIIGKGITYDTGGLSLKPSEGMDTMKTDMSGGAVALGVLYVAASLGIDANITALIPATENSIGSKSYKPGDVHSSYSGKTVEVENTDAEGRLILADAISYAVNKIKPKNIIDIASLTGAISIALGEEIAGVFSNDNKLYKIMERASEETGELIWRLPLYEEYKKMLKSRIADIKNVGGRKAGSITAALFLEEFVKNIPWIHIDIGGCAYFSKPRGYYTSLATGFGVRLILDFLEKL